jgi:N-acetyl-1-D-myo-inositol-2-amino-2-deoxy-alpha-D-glucopyranoside deacetylase
VPDGRAHTAIDIGDWLDTKLQALEAHLTQVSVWWGPPPCFALSNGIAQPALAVEHFELAHGPSDGVATDLFGGIA